MLITILKSLNLNDLVGENTCKNETGVMFFSSRNVSPLCIKLDGQSYSNNSQIMIRTKHCFLQNELFNNVQVARLNITILYINMSFSY
jgi:hypothetical protein